MQKRKARSVCAERASESKDKNQTSDECEKPTHRHCAVNHLPPRGCRHHRRYSCGWVRNWNAKAPDSCGSARSTSVREPNCYVTAANKNAAAAVAAGNKNAAEENSCGCRRCWTSDCRCSWAWRNDRCWRPSQPTMGDRCVAFGRSACPFATAYWGGWIASAPEHCCVQNPVASGHDPWQCPAHPRSARTSDWRRDSQRGQIHRWSSGSNRNARMADGFVKAGGRGHWVWNCSGTNRRG